MDNHKQLVGAEACIASVFPHNDSRPGLRTFRQWQAHGYFPYHKIGRRTYFDPGEVRSALERRFRVNAKEI